MFDARFEGVSGVRVTGKTGKSGVSGELWVGWVSLRKIYIYLLHARTRMTVKISHIQKFAYLYGDFVVTEIVTIRDFYK